jgi:hypothetical protein
MAIKTLGIISPPSGKTEKKKKGAAENPTGEFSGSIRVSQKVPTRADLDKVADIPVLDAEGRSRTFRSLYSSESGSKRVLIVFVRHFFCGVRFPPPPLSPLLSSHNPEKGPSS